jgi:hypothetical protein
VEGLCFNETKENITFGKEKIPCQLDDENRDLGYEQKYYFSDKNYKKSGFDDPPSQVWKFKSQGLVQRFPWLSARLIVLKG